MLAGRGRGGLRRAAASIRRAAARPGGVIRPLAGISLLRRTLLGGALLRRTLLRRTLLGGALLGRTLLGRALLGRMRETARLPVLTKPAAVRTLDAAAQRLFALEARAANLYTLAYPELRAAVGGALWRETARML